MDNLEQFIEQLKAENRLVLKSIAGSHLYGLNTATSDLDIRGIFINTKEELYSLTGHQDEAGDEKSDIKYYCLEKFFKLVSDCNPNILELLWLPVDAILYTSPIYEKIIANRELFISKKAYYTFSGYAFSQIQRAKGKNKKANFLKEYYNEPGINFWANEYLMEPEKIQRTFGSDFCKYLDKIKGTIEENNYNIVDAMKMYPPQLENYIYFYESDVNGFPFRPIVANTLTNVAGWPSKFNETFIQYGDVAGLEHSNDLYRLYKNGRGFLKDGQIVCASISKEREGTDFIGLININLQEYKKALGEYHSFWNWMASRNEDRYANNWDEEKTYDGKNMMHTLRLLMCSKQIALEGIPLVRFEGKDREFLLEVKTCKHDYDYLLKMSEDLMEEVKVLFEQSSLPKTADMKKINQLYLELNGV